MNIRGTIFLFLIVLNYSFANTISWDDIINEVKEDNDVGLIIPKDKEHYFKSKKAELEEIKQHIKKSAIEIKKDSISALGANNVNEQNAEILKELSRISKNLAALDKKIAILKEQNRQLSKVVSKIIEENNSNYRKSLEDIATLQNETNFLKMENKKVDKEFKELKLEEYNKRKQLEEVVNSFDERITKIEEYIQHTKKTSKEIEAQNKEIDQVKKGVFYLADELKSLKSQNDEFKTTLIKMILKLKEDKIKNEKDF